MLLSMPDSDGAVMQQDKCCKKHFKSQEDRSPVIRGDEAVTQGGTTTWQEEWPLALERGSDPSTEG